MAHLKKSLLWLPACGIVLFIALYFFAAFLYPGGTAFDHNSVGYSHLANFWCDLMDSTTYSGMTNPARIYALAGTILLPTTLMPFWLFVPSLFNGSQLAGSITRGFGVLAMASASSVPFAHDLMVNFTSFFVAIAFAATAFGLLRGKQFFLFALALVPIALFVANYLMWSFAYELKFMPAVQKSAFILLCIWIVISMRRIWSEATRPGTRRFQYSARA